MLKDYPFVEKNENFFQRIKILVYLVVELLQKKQLTTFQISNSKNL